MKKKIIFLFIGFIFVTVSAFADVIILKSGRQLEGKILERNSESVKVDFYGVGITYFLDDIAQINGEKINPVSAEPAASKEPTVPSVELKAPSPESTVPPAESVAPPTESTALPVKVISPDSRAVPEKLAAPEPISLERKAALGVSAVPRIDAEKLKKAKTVCALLFTLIIFIFIVLAFVFSAICLQFIAKKTNKAPVWLAWIPVGNLFLMCKIGAVSYWWLLIIFGAFIPFVGIIINLGFSGFLWYKIALARNKPAWLGILCAIPLVGFVIMAYLAFSN